MKSKATAHENGSRLKPPTRVKSLTLEATVFAEEQLLAGLFAVALRGGTITISHGQYARDFQFEAKE